MHQPHRTDDCLHTRFCEESQFIIFSWIGRQGGAGSVELRMLGFKKAVCGLFIKVKVRLLMS